MMLGVCIVCSCAFTQVDPSGKYEDLVTIRGFEPHFHLAGGVNLPKILDCVGSDGQRRRQLVKVRMLNTHSNTLVWNEEDWVEFVED